MSWGKWRGRCLGAHESFSINFLYLKLAIFCLIKHKTLKNFIRLCNISTLLTITYWNSKSIQKLRQDKRCSIGVYGMVVAKTPGKSRCLKKGRETLMFSMWKHSFHPLTQHWLCSCAPGLRVLRGSRLQAQCDLSASQWIFHPSLKGLFPVEQNIWF